MPLLEQTQSAISELAGDRQREFGSHLGHMPKKNMPGINLGEIPFDPSKHSLSDVSLFSLSEQATGIPHVQNVLPRRALNIQIVEDRSPSNDDSRIVKVKHNLANYLQESISDSKPGMTDRVRRFIITDAETEDPDLLGYDVELIDANEGPEAFTQTVAELCRDSLTLVISDFKRLRLDLVTNEEFDKVVGIKANHTAEMEMP